MLHDNGSSYATGLHLFGQSVVFLPIPAREKGPKLKGWQELTVETSHLPQHEALLQHAVNIGILLGPASSHIVDIDLDTDDAVTLFAAVNRDLVNRTLQTMGSRGRHFFFRIKGPYPQRVIRLEAKGEGHVGEWRGGGGAQTVIAGIHPSGKYYSVINDQPLLEIEFKDLIWPHQWVTPSIEERPEEVVEKYQKLHQGVITAVDLARLDVPVRSSVIGSWCKQGDLVFIYGQRGSGKTWLTAALAIYASKGRDLLEWEIPQPWNVLWIDGEMPLSDFRERVTGLFDEPTERLSIIHHEHFHNLGLGTLNLADSSTQQALTLFCLERHTTMLVLDNLSCLFSGIVENDADAWEAVLPWLLELRRHKITVFIVAHAGRAGLMRGTSKREDAAAAIIKVESMAGKEEDLSAAVFSTTFTKQRSGEHFEGLREWRFISNADGEVEIFSESRSFDEQVYDLIKLGIDTATEIAIELGCAKSTVSKAAKRLLDRKFIFKKGRAYQCIKLVGES